MDVFFFFFGGFHPDGGTHVLLISCFQLSTKLQNAKVARHAKTGALKLVGAQPFSLRPLATSEPRGKNERACSASILWPLCPEC